MRLRVRYINLAPRINGLLVSAARHLAEGARNSMSYSYCADFPASEHVFTYRPSCRKHRKNLAGIYLLNWLCFANICFWDAYKIGVSFVSKFKFLLHHCSALLINSFHNIIHKLLRKILFNQFNSYKCYHSIRLKHVIMCLITNTFGKIWIPIWIIKAI